MIHSIHKQIVTRIIKKRRGKLIFPADFNDLGNGNAVKTSLSRLVNDGMLERLAQGIYLYPKHDNVLGTLYPSAEDIAYNIAKRDKARIIPTGVAALHRLRLSTQVPMKLVYLTDGAPRKIKVGKHIITFKSTTAKRLAAKGKISSMVIQALLELGKEAVTDQVLNRITEVLQQEDKKKIKEDSKLAPAWIASILLSIMEKLEKDDRVAGIN
ncbi:DUF6088 family protein [Daejeonella sp.]|uniref:DUF6088 family protein n=1 Tax=Daejeonella sp. TaxID=2805397 RepID=UPI0030C01346